MKSSTYKIIFFLVLMLATGCANSVKKLNGSIGHWTYYKVSAETFSGHTMAIKEWDGTNAPQTVCAQSGEGGGAIVMKALSSSAGYIGGGAAIGLLSKPTKIDVKSGNLSNETFAQGGEVYNTPAH